MQINRTDKKNYQIISTEAKLKIAKGNQIKYTYKQKKQKINR